MKRWLSVVLAAAFVLACSKERIVPEPKPAPVPGPEVVPPTPEDEKTEKKLTGVVIGTAKFVDYSTGNASATVNKRENVFDGNFDTFFATYDRSHTWVGLDLGEKHRITKVGFAARKTQESRVQLALFEGANQPDFSDALPLVMMKEKGKSGAMQYLSVEVTRAFRYVRYVGPSDARCNLAELEFYGWKEAGDDSRLYQLTNLPTVVINTANAKEITSKEIYTPSVVYIISEGGTRLLSTTNTGVRGRGNASWDFPKKPYKLRFEFKHSILGAPASDRKWTLINNYGDKTLMRNILAFEVSRRVGMAYTPFCTPVDLIFNGEYQGCYQLCDQVEAGTGRVEGAKDGYLVEIDAYAYNEKKNFYSAQGIPVTVKNPDSDEITPQQFNFIRTFFGQFETAMFSAGYANAQTGYRKYMDVRSFLQNFIVGEFCGNTDTYWSMYMYKDAANGAFYIGPAWDYDLAFENDQRTYPINNLSDYIYAVRGSVAADAVRTMVNRIVKQDEEAKAQLAQMWDQVKPSLENLNDYVDETAALLDESQKLNFVRWPILGQRVHQNNQAKGSYAGEVKVVKDYITGRLVSFDKLVHK